MAVKFANSIIKSWPGDDEKSCDLLALLQIKASENWIEMSSSLLVSFQLWLTFAHELGI